MATDYNIYIHNLGGSNNQSSPTKAWTSEQSSPTKAWTSSIEESESSGGMKGMSSPVAAFKAVGSVIKAHPVISAAVAVITLADKIISFVSPHITLETGDYRFTTHYNNFKSGLGVLFKPFSSINAIWNENQQNYLSRVKGEQSRLMLGESFDNSYSRRV